MRIVRTGERVDAATARPRIASGEVLVTVTANTVSSATVTFPTGRFTTTPTITATAVSGAPGEVREVCITNPSATGCTLSMLRTNGVNTSVFWIAYQG